MTEVQERLIDIAERHALIVNIVRELARTVTRQAAAMRRRRTGEEQVIGAAGVRVIGVTGQREGRRSWS